MAKIKIEGLSFEEWSRNKTPREVYDRLTAMDVEKGDDWEAIDPADFLILEKLGIEKIIELEDFHLLEEEGTVQLHSTSNNHRSQFAVPKLEAIDVVCFFSDDAMVDVKYVGGVLTIGFEY